MERDLIVGNQWSGKKEKSFAHLLIFAGFSESAATPMVEVGEVKWRKRLDLLSEDISFLYLFARRCLFLCQFFDAARVMRIRVFAYFLGLALFRKFA